MLYMYTRTNESKERHMFFPLIYLVLLVILGASCGMLYRVTFPGCTSRRCTEHTITN